MGSANERLPQPFDALQGVDKNLYSKGPLLNSQEHPERVLLPKNEVESDTALSQVVPLSKRYHPYGETSRDSASIYAWAQQAKVLRRSPACWESGESAGPIPPANKFQP